MFIRATPVTYLLSALLLKDNDAAVPTTNTSSSALQLKDKDAAVPTTNTTRSTNAVKKAAKKAADTPKQKLAKQSVGYYHGLPTCLLEASDEATSFS
jgi:hypothetical protein